MKVYVPVTGKVSQTVHTKIHKSMFQSDTPGTRSVNHAADVVTQSVGNGILIVFYFDAICMELILCFLIYNFQSSTKSKFSTSFFICCNGKPHI